MPDEAFIRSALDKANLNVLRIALYQATGDEALAQMRVVKKPIRGGAFYASVLADEHADEVKERALTYLMNAPETSTPADPPSAAELRRLMEMLTGDPLSDSAFRMGREELGLEDFPRGVSWQAVPPAERLAAKHVSIIGAGIAGLATAVQLQRLGIPYTVFERQSEIGGVWARNRYPEVRVDTSSYFYQFTFEKNYPWPQFYANGAETRKYLTHVATKYGVLPNITFNSEVESATWEDTNSCWQLEVVSTDGERSHMRSDFVVSASGLFSTPRLPDIDGIESFAGKICHTAEWDQSLDPTGKRVALIGTGSTGTQILPHLASVGSKVTVFQRTPNWIAALDGYKDAVTPATQWLFDTLPYYWNWYCYSLFVASSGLQDGEVYDPEWIRQGGKISKMNDTMREFITEYITSTVGNDPALVAACVPTYAPLGRRPVVDNGFYEALTRDNVELVTDKIERILPTGIVTSDGREHPLDVIVLAAGFHVDRYFWPVTYAGRDGVTVEELWSTDGPRSYLSLMMPGFPNLFTVYGPNASPRAGGYYTWAELWSRFIVTCIANTIEAGKSSVEVRPEVYADYNRRLDAAMKDLIWQSESEGSYYLGQNGRVVVKMPWRVEDYYEWIAEPNPDDLIVK